MTAAADDEVITRTADGERTLRGEVLDYNGAELTLRPATGRERTIPAAEVIVVRTAYTAEQQAGEALYADNRWSEAAAQFRGAGRLEKRTWVQRLLLARLCRCYDNLGESERAVAAFLSLLKNDPQTPYFGDIPLQWLAGAPTAALETAAKGWLDDSSNETAALIGASYLLSGSRHRTAAITVLQQLSSSRDPRIAHLADAQLWRTKLPTAAAEELGRWKAQIQRMPENLRGGPYFVLGQGLALKSQPQDAALALLRAPVLFPDQARLGADALARAGQELEKLGQPDAAANVYRELLQKHGSSLQAAEASERLKRLGS